MTKRQKEALCIVLMGFLFLIGVLIGFSKLDQEALEDCWVIEANYKALEIYDVNPNAPILDDSTKAYLTANRSAIVSEYDKCSSKSFYIQS